VTNAAGRLLVPGLRAFEINRLAVDPADIPQDASLNDAAREVRPQDRSGVVVRFPVKMSRGALLRLVDGAGTPVPVGSTATLKSTGEAVPVGYDGDAYVEGLEPQNEVAVELANGQRCSVSFSYQPVPGEIPSIGPLTCRDKKP
jgi:outer membrane usher protein